MTTIKQVIMAISLLVLLVFAGLFAYYGSIIVWPPDPKPALPTGWYIVPPSNYFHLKEPQKNEVVQWLEGVPYHKSYLNFLIESPYTYDEWLRKGHSFENVEKILLELYCSRYSSLLEHGLSEALKFHGSQKTIIFFKDQLLKCEFSHEERVQIYDILYGIINDQEEFSKFLEDIQKEKESLEDDVDETVDSVFTE